jgi:hypothetical protein
VTAMPGSTGDADALVRLGSKADLTRTVAAPEAAPSRGLVDPGGGNIAVGNATIDLPGQRRLRSVPSPWR